jgi:serine/threonine protein kinase/tetratricopeptide (TPR) repeat protein
MASSLSHPASSSRTARPSATDPDSCVWLAIQLADRLAASWQGGVHRSVETYLADHPWLRSHPRAMLRLVGEELRQRIQCGQDVSLSELHVRFPDWRNELAALLERLRSRPEESTHVLGAPDMLQHPVSRTCFPDVGTLLGEFRLLAEVGRGGTGRVYLAEQAFLAGRRMILKITPFENQEHLTLARLQHTHIVPIYSVRDFPERDLRCLCMPCLGGATLRQLLDNLRDRPPAQRRGCDLVHALATSVADPRLFWVSNSPTRRALEGASYVQAVCWIGVCLADALHHAHTQGMVHLDVKPSNVLLTADCQPMLLDFHLARGPIQPQHGMPQWLGGTTAYLSPEQRAAMRAYHDRVPITVAVDARSDVYGLGLLLVELLHRRYLSAEADTASILIANPEVSRGLCDVVARCLRPHPAERYPSAGLLAEDLRRHLTDRPLIGVRNRSLPERFRKWRRRHPHRLFLFGLVAVCVMGALTFGGLYAVQAARHRQEADRALDLGRRQFEQRHYAAAVETLEHGLQHVAGAGLTPGFSTDMHRLLGQARRARDIETLHQQVDRLRYVDESELARPAMLALEALCRAAWADRERLCSADEFMDARTEANLHRDLSDVATLWARLRVRLAAPAEATAARQEALAVLRQAETRFGASLAVRLQRHALEQGPDRPIAAPIEPAPATAWEFYTLGRWLFTTGDLAGAAAAFDSAVDLSPQDFWPWYGKGLCSYRQKRPDLAAHAFTVCLALAPDSAACYHNRGLARAADGDNAGALRDYDRALRLDPHLALAALHRGEVRLQQQQLAEAELDFRVALKFGANPAAVHYGQARLHLARRESDAALASVERALHHDPNHRPSQELRQQLQKENAPGDR